MKKWLKLALVAVSIVASVLLMFAVAIGAWIATCTDCFQFG